MFGNKPTKPQNRIDSLVGAGTVIEGNIAFSGGLRVDGRIRGNVLTADDPAKYAGRERKSADRRRDSRFACRCERNCHRSCLWC